MHLSSLLHRKKKILLSSFSLWVKKAGNNVSSWLARTREEGKNKNKGYWERWRCMPGEGECPFLWICVTFVLRPPCMQEAPSASDPGEYTEHLSLDSLICYCSAMPQGPRITICLVGNKLKQLLLLSCKPNPEKGWVSSKMLGSPSGDVCKAFLKTGTWFPHPPGLLKDL